MRFRPSFAALGLCAILAWASLGTPTRATGNVVAVSPADTWCAMINAAQPGDELVFAPGNYPQSCFIRSRGAAQASIKLHYKMPKNNNKTTLL